MRIGRVTFNDRIEPAIFHDGSWLRAGACGEVAPGATATDLLNQRESLVRALDTVNVEAMIGSGDAVREADAVLATPLQGPRAIVAVGLNYREHAAEVSWEAPPTPLVFAKWPSALTGPFDRIALDPSVSAQVDYEVELAAVIGRPTLDVSVDDALDHISGYAVANDISARDIQSSESQWTRAKSFDGFCPIGPWITTADEIPDPQNLKLSCTVNGEVRQQATTARMIHGVAQLIAYVSRATTLQPGDLVLTGTPSGVAMAAETPRWLEPGDVVRSEVEGLGYLENKIVSRTAAAMGA